MKAHLAAAVGLLALSVPLPAQTLETAPDGPLEQQWQWALTESAQQRSSTGFWVGFSFPRLMKPHHYVWSGGTFSWSGGRMFSRGTPLIDWIERGGEFPGAAGTVSVATEGDEEALVRRQIAVLLAFPPGAREARRSDGARVRDVELPFDPEGRSLIWLGEQTSEAAFDLLRRLYAAEPAERVREELVTAAALHDQPAAVIDFVDGVLGADPSERVRDEAVSSLRRAPAERSVTLLKRTIADDSSERVRREAVEALGRQGLDSAELALIEIATGHDSRRIRREAIEQLAESASRRATDTLQGIASDEHDVLKRRALEALVEMDGGIGVEAVIEIARAHPSVTVRKLAIRELGDSDDPRAHQALIEIVRASLNKP